MLAEGQGEGEVRQEGQGGDDGGLEVGACLLRFLLGVGVHLADKLLEVRCKDLIEYKDVRCRPDRL